MSRNRVGEEFLYILCVTPSIGSQLIFHLVDGSVVLDGSIVQNVCIKCFVEVPERSKTSISPLRYLLTTTRNTPGLMSIKNPLFFSRSDSQDLDRVMIFTVSITPHD